MLSRIGLVVCLFALATGGQAQSATKPAHTAKKPAAAAPKPAPPAKDPALAIMSCPQAAKGAEAQPKASAKTASSATAKGAQKTAAKDLMVCGYTLTHALHTFPDACQAQAAGAMVLHAGACNGEFCPAQSCAADHGVVARRVANGQIKSYDNVCWAEKDHAVYLRAGKCPSQQGH